jgi:hypothetical protein
VPAASQAGRNRHRRCPDSEDDALDFFEVHQKISLANQWSRTLCLCGSIQKNPSRSICLLGISLVAFVFGLLHGFGFAGALADLGLPQGDIPLALFSFNIGAEIGQLMFIAAMSRRCREMRELLVWHHMARRHMVRHHMVRHRMVITTALVRHRVFVADFASTV